MRPNVTLSYDKCRIDSLCSRILETIIENLYVVVMRGSFSKHWVWIENVWRPNSNVVEGETSIKVRSTLDSRTCLQENMHRRTISNVVF